MRTNPLQRLLSFVLVIALIVPMLPVMSIHAHAASGNLTMTSEGLTAGYSGSGTWSGGGTSASGTVSGKNGFISALNSAQTATLTFKNGRDKTATLSFDYNITKNTGSVTIKGTTVTGSGTYETEVNAGNTVQVVIKSGKGTSNTTAIDLANISLVVDASATTTFKVAENGTYTVNGTTITSETAMTQSSTESYELAATPNAGYAFLGWYSTETNSYFSDNPAASLKVENDMTVYPVFISVDTPVFRVGTDRYTDFAEAITAASAHSTKQLTLTKSGTLAAGEYTIPADVKLLIPFSSAFTANFGDEPALSMSGEGPSMYVCLTLAEGAVINCYGAINVNATQYASSAQYTGHVTGGYGAIHLNSGTQLNMKSGSNLYAYGYIGGEGMVWAESGSNIYQFFQIRDWRGGNDSATLLSSLKNNSFLFSQYYLQNIEATLRLDSGCTMYGSAAIAAGLGSSKSPNQTCAAIMGKNTGMFHVTDGYATMKYDAATDRMTLDFYGSLVTDAISMKMNLTGLVSSSMNTADYILALPMNYTINMKPGSTVTFAQKFKAMPGTVINIEQGAAATIAANGALYLYDVDDWNSGTYAYNKTIFQLGYVYARKGTPVGRSVTDDAVLNLNGTFTANGPIYSTKHTENGGNAGITGNGVFANNAYGSTNLKEVVGSNTTELTTIACVPVTGFIAGYDAQQSLAQGTHKSIDGKWYQHTVTGSGFEVVSGGETVNGTIYVGGTKDSAANIVVKAAEPCVTATNATISKNEDGTHTISLTGNSVVTATAHTPKDVAGKDATCTENGITAGVVCSVCGEILTAQETIPAHGHTEEIIPKKDATCTETGLTEGKKCSVCGVTLVEQQVVSALGHTSETIQGTPATCTQTGLTSGSKCSVCGETITAQEEIPALGHDHSYAVEGTAKAPTCTVDGKELDMKCSRCDDVVTGAVIPATGHNHSILVENSAKAPTCTVDGKEADVKCANCDDVQTGASIPATGHDEVSDVAVAPTCTQTGLTAGKHCATCGETLVAQEVVDALGHDYVSVVTAPTCTDQGYTTHTCSRCGDSYVDSYIDPVGTNHVYDSQKTVEPTCTADGYTANVCSLCGHEETVEGSVKPAYGHTFSYGVQTPTCTEGGYTVRTCEECDYSDTVDVTAPLGHDCVPTVTAPTCTEQGYTTHNCSRCEYTHIPADSYKPALGHQFEMAVLTATCTEGGYTKYECSDCGHSYIPEESRTEALGHCYYKDSVEVVITPPTCTEQGYTTHNCYCGEHSHTFDYVPATGHAYGDWVVTNPATCTEAGERTKTCDACGDAVKETVPATGHNHVPTVTAPTCEEDGYTTYTCACGDTYTDNRIDALGHTEAAIPAVDATCTTPGYTEGTKCSVCDAILVAPEEIAMLEHTYGEWEIATIASCTTEGVKARYCTACNHAETQTSEKLPHTVVIDPAVATRYDASGLTEGSHCSACDEILVAQTEIAQLKLDWENFKVAMASLEQYAKEYALSNPGKDPVKLMINYLRTGVERYNDEEWITLAGAAETVFIEEVLAKDNINGTIAYALREFGYTKNIKMPNGQTMEFDHLFGALNVSSKSNYGINNTDFGSWVGDLCDLMEFAYKKGFKAENFADIEAMVAEITSKYFGKLSGNKDISAFSTYDLNADLDAFYFVSKIKEGETSLSKLFEEYYTENLSGAQRAAYFLNNRFPGALTKDEVRFEIFNTYSDNILAQILEASREVSDLALLREASCYTLADHLYELADGLLVAPEENPDDTPGGETPSYAYKVFDRAASTIAPGVDLDVCYAVDKDNKQMVYYMATVDITRSDVDIYANYANNDPSLGWAMATVSSQMTAAQNKHSDPNDTANYIPNYNVVVGQNANFYNMNTGEPSGLFVMEGTTYANRSCNFFAILKDGTPIICEESEYDTYKDQIQEAVGGSQMLIRDGVNLRSADETHKYPRSCVGITADGQVVMIVVDGSQAPFSVGATYYEIAEIMLDAGCVAALELDGGGSATFDAKPEGSDTVQVINRPSDRYERSVSSSLMVVSTANVSKEFDRAIVSTPTTYITPGSSFKVELIGVSESGGSAEIPEGAYLQVSDETIGTVSEGTFNALKTGSVELQLVVDGEIVGSKTVEVITRPDGLKFDGNNLNLIYGNPVELPLVATYNSSHVTINTDDITYELSNETAGVMDGFSFIGDEASGVRNVTVTAMVKTDVNISASISLRLYSSEESIFDFDNATAGNESLAWNRVVDNTYTTDNTTYYVVDKEADVTANYTFAIDMKAITAPARLQPLMEYLNGFAGNVGDNATPWDYMLALGNRVSPLTNVTIKAVFSEGVEVDVSDVNFVNDFLRIKSYVYDEATRTLTISCSWLKNTSEEGIDPSTANSIAILSGVKLTPSEGALDNGVLDVNVLGDVTYDIYLDAGSLHSFASDTANQEKYGLYPYINPDNADDAGGHFASTYITFEDNFNVVNESLNGWITRGEANDIYYYYVNNEMITGIYLAPDIEGSENSYYYDFGDDGIYRGIYTGLFYDESVSGYRYARFGELQGGWLTIAGKWHYFDQTTKVAYTGDVYWASRGITYHFDETGMTEGVWEKTALGTRYWYGLWYYVARNDSQRCFTEIDGKTYNFDINGYVTTGIHVLYNDYTALMRGAMSVWEFDENGALIGQITAPGVVDTKRGDLYLIEEDGLVHARKEHLAEYNGELYFVNHSGRLTINGYKTITEANSNGLIASGTYYFGEDGKLFNATCVKEAADGILYYYQNGQLGTRLYNNELVAIDGSIYMVYWSGKVAVNTTKTITTTNSNGLVALGTYYIDKDGKLCTDTGVRENENGILHYYKEGQLGTRLYDSKLVEINGAIYMVYWSGKVAANETKTITTTNSNGLVAPGTYYIGKDGKLCTDTGVRENESGILHYYKEGQLGTRLYDSKLVKINGAIYMVYWSGKVAANETKTITTTNSNGLVAPGTYYIGKDGKLCTDTCVRENESGTLYYYKNGQLGTRLHNNVLVEINGAIYMVCWSGKVVVNATRNIVDANSNGLLTPGTYYFGTDGKLFTGVKEDADGILYYYKNGQLGARLHNNVLVEINGAIYMVCWSGKVVVNATRNITTTNSNGLAAPGTYSFGEDGKMFTDTCVKEDAAGILYYYKEGQLGTRMHNGALVEIDGSIYLVYWSGKVAVNVTKTITAANSNGLVAPGTYSFGADGKLTAK